MIKSHLKTVMHTNAFMGHPTHAFPLREEIKENETQQMLMGLPRALVGPAQEPQ